MTDSEIKSPSGANLTNHDFSPRRAHSRFAALTEFSELCSHASRHLIGPVHPVASQIPCRSPQLFALCVSS
jgi:hypothetical protein